MRAPDRGRAHDAEQAESGASPRPTGRGSGMRGYVEVLHQTMAVSGNEKPPRLARAGAAKLLTARLREGNAVVAHQGHGPVARQSPAQQGSIGTEADARERQNVAFHR